MLLTRLVQELSNLALHAVGYFLILVYAFECLFTLVLCVLVFQLHHHLEHPLHAMTKVGRLELCLQKCHLGRADGASLDILQTHGLLFFVRFVAYHEMAKTLYLRYKPNEGRSIEEIE